MPLLAQHRLSVSPHIVVVRALPGLGDFLCAAPALRALRQLWPEGHIALVGLRSTRQLVARYSQVVDELIPFPGFPGIVEKEPNVEELPSFLREMQARDFDLAIQMHGSGTFINPFTLLLGAARTVGYQLPPAQLPDSHVGNGVFLRYPEELHEIHRNLGLVEVCTSASGTGASDKFASGRSASKRVGSGSGWLEDVEDWEWDDRIEFPLNDADEAAYGSLAQEYGLQVGEYVALHAGASVATRRWSPEWFAEVGAWLREQGYQVVLTGTEGDAEATARVAAQLGEPLVDLTGKTDLGAVGLVVKNARLLVCNDTGVSHVAAAVETPSVVLCINSDWRRWAPLNRARHRPIAAEDGNKVRISAVLEAVRDALETSESASDRGIELARIYSNL